MFALGLGLVKMSLYLSGMDCYYGVGDYSRISLEVSYAFYHLKTFVADFPSIRVVT